MLLRKSRLYGIAEQHADDGYSRRGNFGGSLVHSLFSMYSPDTCSTDVYESRGGDRCRGLKVVKS